MKQQTLADRFWRDGFVIVRNLFDPQEVRSFRELALEGGETGRDLLSQPGLSDLLLDNRILDCFRSILGQSELVYFGDSSVMIGETAAGFHKDNPDKVDPRAPDWQLDRYPLVRMGLYTTDHSRFPDGVDLRRGSHKYPSLTKGEHVQPDLRVGDVVFWNLRTSHSGGAMKLLGHAVNPASYFGRLLRKLPAVRDKPHERRVAFFATFALAGPQLERFIESLKFREYAVSAWRASRYDPGTLDRAGARGLTVRDVAEEIAAEPPRQLHRDHVSLPY